MATRLSGSRKHRPLAAGVAAALALASPVAADAAATWTVNTCDQGYSGSGTTGSLRYAATNAASGDTIDLTGLACSTISLTTGAVMFAQNSITLNGPGMTHLTVTGKYNGNTEKDRIFTHTGTGTFAVNNLSVSKGYSYAATGNAKGGCIYSAGTAYLSHVGAYFCKAFSAASGRAQGGGVYGKSAVDLKYSVVESNTASGAGNVGGYGGGVYSKNSFVAKYSTVSGNTAGNSRGFGGGVFVYGSGTVKASTISGNTAKDNGGGIYAHNFFTSAANTLTIKNSTVSGNSAGYYTGGVIVNSGTVYIDNSTIVFNTAAKGRFGSYPFTYRAPGVATSDAYNAVAVTLQSSLIANNTYGSSEYDLSVPKRSSTTVTFSGANNLVRATFAAVPSGTIKISCPLLGPLKFNGGPTQTHALLSHSPGIDQGNNVLGLSFDQRQSPFSRQSGSATDIGAYEVQQGDVVFNNGFDGCPLLF
ncbi:MAG TPA: choice-of-anchor Q domain-containing protein [Rudaea sp.]|nr:choice-of-anchor Q domain-containing protein [Rudaea sp.]